MSMPIHIPGSRDILLRCPVCGLEKWASRKGEKCPQDHVRMDAVKVANGR